MNSPHQTFRTPTLVKYLVASIATYLAVTSSARADATWVGDTNSLWNDAANWSSDPANPTGNFFINTATGAFPILSGADSLFTPVDVFIGNDGLSGRLDHVSGGLSLANTGSNGNWFFVGRNGGSGTYNLADTSVVTPGSTSGFGLGSGSLTVGKLWVGGGFFGDNGTGVVNINTTGTITGNSLDFDGAPVILGVQAGTGTASGTINLENGTIQSNGQVWVGFNDTGVINQSGGTVNSTSWFVVGRNSGSEGQYNMTGGTVNAASGNGFAVLGSFGGSQGQLNVSGGTFNVANNAQLIVGEGGAGTMNVSGTGLVTVNHATEGVRLAANSGSSGTVNLDGGTIQTTLVSKGAGTGNFSFNGGKLKAAIGGETFMQGLTNAFVKAGGAIIDSNGFAITIAQPLIADPVSANGGLSKVGAGSLTLTGANTYTGATNVTAGTLSISGAGAINASSGIVINGLGAKFVQSSSTTSTPVITLTQGTLDGTGSVGAVTVGAGTGGIVANGNGTTGQLTIGSLTFAGAGALSFGIAGGAATNTPGIAVMNGLTTPNNPGSITVNVAPTNPLTLGTSYSLLSYGTSFSGAMADFVYGGNTARLTGSFANTGSAITLTVNGDAPKWTGLDGSLWQAAATGANSNWKLQTALTATDYIAGDLVLFDDTATGTRNVNISAASVLPGTTTFNNSGAAYTVNSSGGFGIAGTGSVVKNGSGKVTFTTANTTSGPVTVNAGILELGDGTTDGSFANSASITNNGTLAYNVAGNQAYGNAIAGTGSVTKAGPGTLTLSGANTYAGGTTLNAGLLVAGNGSALGTGSLKLAGGTFGASAGATIANPLEVTGTSTIGYAGQNGDITFAGNVVGNGTIKNFVGTPNASNVHFSGDLSGFTGTLEYTSRSGDDAQWWRVGANGATVDMSNARLVLQLGTATTNAPSKNFGFRDFISNSTLKVGALSGDGVFQSSFNNAGPNTLEVGHLNTNTTFSGAIAGAGAGANMALTKVGSGTLKLTGTNFYGGDTNINAGKLTINGLIGGTSRVNNGGTLAGAGSMGWTILNEGGAIAPGDDGIGTLTVAGGARYLDWYGDSSGSFGQMKFELSTVDSTSDRIVGLEYFTKASVGGSFIFDFGGTGANLAGGAGTVYTLIEFQNLGAINGASSFTPGDFGYVNLDPALTGTFLVNASSVQIQVVPEPGSAAMLLGGIGMLCFRRRSRIERNT